FAECLRVDRSRAGALLQRGEARPAWQRLIACALAASGAVAEANEAIQRWPSCEPLTPLVSATIDVDRLSRQGDGPEIVERLDRLAARYPADRGLAFRVAAANAIAQPNRAADWVVHFTGEQGGSRPERLFAEAMQLFSADAARRRAGAEFCRQALSNVDEPPYLAFLTAWVLGDDTQMVAAYTALAGEWDDDLPCAPAQAQCAVGYAR